VPESKISKKRVHLDIRVTPDERDRITALGGTVVAMHARFTTMVDHEAPNSASWLTERPQTSAGRYCRTDAPKRLAKRS
jgi:hypothetical protein